MTIRKLKADEIEVKVKQVTQKGAVVLLYKTARVDMAILDEVYGSNNWECDYKTVNNNLYCGIGVHCDNGIIWKWDCGVESREDGEGNEKKGEASDAFKRAGFKWGIGRELYTAPFIFLNLPTRQGSNNKYELVDKFVRFKVADITYKGEDIERVTIVDTKGNVVYPNNPQRGKINENTSETKPTDQQMSEVERLDIDLNKTAKYLKKQVYDLTSEDVQLAIDRKKKYLEDRESE